MKKVFLHFSLLVLLFSVSKGECGVVENWRGSGYQTFANLFNDFYLGVEGGWASGLFSSSRSSEAGPYTTASSSISDGMDLLAGYHAGGSMGCIINCFMRTDVSYNFISNPVKWQNQFLGQNTHLYDARLNTHLVLWNMYLHLDDFYTACLGFSPYITGGVGIAINHLNRISERDKNGALIAYNQGNNHLNCGARFGLGLLKPFCFQWALDMGFNFDYIGTVRSGNSQDLLTGSSVAIHPYKHTNNWLCTFYLGLKYRL